MKRASILFLAVLFVVSCTVAADAGIFKRIGAGPCDPCAEVPACEPCADVPVCEPCVDPCDPCDAGCGRVGGLLDRVRGIELNLGGRLGGLCCDPCDPCADVPVCEEVVVDVCEPVCDPCDPCAGPRLRGRLNLNLGGRLAALGACDPCAEVPVCEEVVVDVCEPVCDPCDPCAGPRLRGRLNLNLGGRLAGLGACDPCAEVPVCEEVVVEACDPVEVCDPCCDPCGGRTKLRDRLQGLNLGGRLGACDPCGVEPCVPCEEVPVCEPCS